jgi:hypothetical protein
MDRESSAHRERAHPDEMNPPELTARADLSVAADVHEAGAHGGHGGLVCATSAA